MDPVLLGNLAPDLKNNKGKSSKKKRWSTIVDDGNAIVNKRKGHSIKYKLQATTVRTRIYGMVRRTDRRVLGNGS
jgi:hypothetical protein